MKLIKQLFNFYINSSVHVALSVYALSWITLLEFGKAYNENILCFNFFATITGYNFVKYFGVAKFHHRRLTTWLKAIQLFSLICFVLMCFYALKLELKTLVYIGGLGLLTFLYAIPFLPKRLFLDSQQNLRSIGGLKIYLIALIWSGVTVFLPLINTNVLLGADVFITATQQFLFIMALMLPFEIRDLQYDSLKLSTIPQKIGVVKTKLMGVLLLFVFCLLQFFKNDIIAVNTSVLITIALITGVLILISKKEQGKYFSSFLVEGVPVLWLIFMLLFN
ncbi:hypothetical protein GCM10022291_29610 [Postechiella marina]|uniref:Prenyltransferase n=1 Tax=Postechiella marina TaxID=943941 RepID=A0ABP8CFA5_9FLAO